MNKMDGSVCVKERTLMVFNVILLSKNSRPVYSFVLIVCWMLFPEFWWPHYV